MKNQKKTINTYKIIIVDDNEKFRKALKFYLEEALKHEVIGEAKDAQNFFDLDTLIFDADIILMDLFMPEVTGFELVKKIKAYLFEPIKFIAVTMFSEKAYLKELIEVGFNGCVFKNNIYEEISIAMDKVYKDEYYFPEDMKLI